MFFNIKCTLALCFCLLSNAQEAQTPIPQARAAVLHQYVDFALKKSTEASNFAPPVAARAFGYLGLCAHESLVHSFDATRSFSQKLLGFRAPVVQKDLAYDWEVVANEAMPTLIRALFFNLKTADKVHLEQLRTDFLKTKPIETAILNRSKVYGRALAEAIFEYSKSDGGHHGQLQNYDRAFQVKEGAAHWKPQASQAALLPTWGQNRLFFPMDARNVEHIQPVPFSADSSSAFFHAASEVHAACLKVGYKQRSTILFWQDGVGSYTPAGHSLAILQQLLKEENASLRQAAVAYALTAMTLSDAFVWSMRLKYEHALLRPVDYIRAHIDPGFQTVLATPPHPEFPSGHCSQVGAFSHIMAALFDAHYPFLDSTYSARIAPLRFASFDKMAKSVADSRFWAGLHYDFSNQAGLELGSTVAAHTLSFFPKNEKVPSDTALPSAFYFALERSIKVRNYQSLDQIELTSISGKSIATYTENLHSIALKAVQDSHCKLLFYKDGALWHSTIVALRDNRAAHTIHQQSRRPSAAKFRQVSHD